MARENFIGGTWRAAKRADRRGAEPRDRRGARRGSRQRTRGRRRRGRRRGRRVREWSATTPRQRCEMLTQGRRRDRGRPGDDPRARDPQRRQAALDHRVRDGPHRRQLALLRGGRALPRRPRRRRVPGGPHVVPAARPARRRRVDRAVELPAQHGDVEARPRARGRQHRRAEAVGAHAAERARGWRRSPPTSCRPACSTS